MPCSCCNVETNDLYPVKFKYTKKTKKFNVCLECDQKIIVPSVRYIGIWTCPKKGAAYLLDDYSSSDIDELLETNMNDNLRMNLLMFRELLIK